MAPSPHTTSPFPRSTPTALHFVDAGANVSLEAHRSAFLKGTYTRLRNPVQVKDLDVRIHGYDLVELHLAYQDGHTRWIHIRAAHAPNMVQCGAPSIVSQEQLRKRHNINFHYSAVSEPTAIDQHGSFILVMHNQLPHLQTLPGEFTFLIAYKGSGPTSTDTTSWHQRLGHPGKDTMTLALRSEDITGAKYDSHVPLLSCEPCILA
jgi:hypothetical protein